MVLSSFTALKTSYNVTQKKFSLGSCHSLGNLIGNSAQQEGIWHLKYSVDIIKLKTVHNIECMN